MRNQELGPKGENLQRLLGERDGLVKPVPLGDGGRAKIALGLRPNFIAGQPNLAYAVYLRESTDGGRSLLVASRVLLDSKGRVRDSSGVLPSVLVGSATVSEVIEGSDDDVFQNQVDNPHAITFTLESLVGAPEEMDPIQQPEGFAGELLGKMLDSETSFGAREIDFATYQALTRSSSETPPDDSWQSRRWRT